nr:hypothetical protein [Tanacetum cinerariifolium]
MLAEESRSNILLKQKDPMMSEKKVNTKPVDYAVLNQLSQDFKKRFVPKSDLSGEQAFWSQNSVNSEEPNPSTRPTQVKVPKELPTISMVNTSLKKLKHHLASFDVVVKERTTATTITEDSGLIILVFQKGDDLIDAINHMMSFLTAVVTSWYPPTNNQLRNSSNHQKQATINNGRVTVQPIQGRHTSLATGTSRTYTSGASRKNFGKQRTVICYNYKGEGHMSKQCTKPKRIRDESWFKDKVLLV